MLKPTVPESVLIVLTGSLGDIVRGGVVASDIRRSFPDCEISWLVESRWQSLVACHPAVSHVIAFSRGKLAYEWRGVRRALLARRYTHVLDLQRIAKSGFLSLLAGSGIRIGVHAKNAKEGNWLFHHNHVERVADNKSKVHLYRKFSALLGCDLSCSLEFGWKDVPLSDGFQQRFPFTKNEYVVAVLGSSWESKNWVIEGYHRVAQMLLQNTDCSLVLVGDSSQDAVAAMMLDACNSERVISTLGNTSLVDLAGILASARVAFGPDSGPGHLSEAMNTPYVSLFGPTDPDRVAPWGGEERVVSAHIGCQPCARKTCPGLDRLCMRLISPLEVYSLLSRYISQPSKVLPVEG